MRVDMSAVSGAWEVCLGVRIDLSLRRVGAENHRM